ncbi:MAG: FHA domain-containing protein [Actinomycetota bacterium]|nr:FHA domain-containing protein [Actinomycetota bacterium]
MTCPAGHETTATDYCDVCGIAMDAAAPADADSPADTSTLPVVEPDTAGGQNDDGSCPNCKAANPPNALFCEACGYDFTTGSMPRSVPTPTPGPATVTPPADPNPSPQISGGWVAEVWIDPDWYADQKSTDPLPSPGLPIVVPLKHQSILIGRASRSRNITPDIDLSSDNGISRRHAQLTTDGTRWWVEDLGSSNGTYVGSSVGALPTQAIPQGQKKEIGSDDRVYLGAWTRIVVRKASAGEF